VEAAQVVVEAHPGVALQAPRVVAVRWVPQAVLEAARWVPQGVLGAALQAGPVQTVTTGNPTVAVLAHREPGRLARAASLFPHTRAQS